MGRRTAGRLTSLSHESRKRKPLLASKKKVASLSPTRSVLKKRDRSLSSVLSAGLAERRKKKIYLLKKKRKFASRRFFCVARGKGGKAQIRNSVEKKVKRKKKKGGGGGVQSGKIFFSKRGERFKTLNRSRGLGNHYCAAKKKGKKNDVASKKRDDRKGRGGDFPSFIRRMEVRVRHCAENLEKRFSAGRIKGEVRRSLL